MNPVHKLILIVEFLKMYFNMFLVFRHRCETSEHLFYSFVTSSSDQSVREIKKN
jgi:hypothetical protein